VCQTKGTEDPKYPGYSAWFFSYISNEGHYQRSFCRAGFRTIQGYKPLQTD